eukprot:GHUV01011227.1.p1 GENE.GHUV01011227.1~~GHUV01011227.1.p1  ORF type:complete len:194 (+),score=7.29 GHUV01011227.1:2059-2640(+)
MEHRNTTCNAICYYVFRKDMLDEAMLRPGRLEVQIEIGLPDEKGRLQILKIHTSRVGVGDWATASVTFALHMLVCCGGPGPALMLVFVQTCCLACWCVLGIDHGNVKDCSDLGCGSPIPMSHATFVVMAQAACHETMLHPTSIVHPTRSKPSSPATAFSAWSRRHFSSEVQLLIHAAVYVTCRCQQTRSSGKM